MPGKPVTDQQARLYMTDSLHHSQRAAAARAGFAGIGLFTGEYARLRDDEGRPARELARLLDDHGVVVADTEGAEGGGEGIRRGQRVPTGGTGGGGREDVVEHLLDPLAARLADLFVKEILSKADFGIDLHTGAIDRANLPQIRGDMDDPDIAEMAHAFGAPVAVNASMRDGSLRACAAQNGIPVMVYEAGEALRFDELSIRAGVRGIVQVMRRLGMLPELKRGGRTHTVVARTTRWVRAPSSGIVTPAAELGHRVSKGDRLALICDPLGGMEADVVAPIDGIVIGCGRKPLAYEGDALFHLADFRSVGRAEGAVEEFNATHDPALRRTVEPNLLET